MSGRFYETKIEATTNSNNNCKGVSIQRFERMNAPAHPVTPCNDSKVKKVATLLQELKRASLRPLYIEITIHKRRIEQQHVVIAPASDNYESNRFTSNESVPIIPDANRSWVEILEDAIILSPFLSEDEHGEVLRLCSIYLLAFLLPYSTGMDYYFAQNLPTAQQSLDLFSIDDYLIQMSLEERLDITTRNGSFTDRCGDDEYTVTDQDTEIALGALLDQFIKYLQQRPLHTHQVDLIHLFAMIIHPCHSKSPSLKTIYPTISKGSPAWAKAVRLMENSTSSKFQIHYGHRRQIVQMISSCIFIREGLNDYVPLFAGALPHLFATLHQFYCCTSEDQLDAHNALRAIVALAVQTRHKSTEKEDDFSIIQSTYDWLIDLIMEERGDFPSVENVDRNTTGNSVSKYNGHSYFARGEVLSDLIGLSSSSKSAASDAFLSYVTTSLSDLIEWQVDYWSLKLEEVCSADNANADNDAGTYPPCLLASLLFAARQVFSFYATQSNVKHLIDENDPYTSLIRSSISMLRHHDCGIVAAAKDLILQAFNGMQGKQSNKVTSQLCQSISKTIIQQNNFDPLMRPLVALISSRSVGEAESLLNFILPHLEGSSANAVKDSTTSFPILEASTWLLIIAINCPLVSSKKSCYLLSLGVSKELPVDNFCLVAKALIYDRLTHYFINSNDVDVSSAVETLASSPSNDPWEQYKMGRHALVAGHSRLAQQLFRHLLDECERMETSHYIWIVALERLSDAEAVFSTMADPKSSKGSSIGIPYASTQLHSVASYIELLHTTCTIWGDSGSFQLRFVLLRLDFLDLVTVLRHVTRERRLTGKSPNKTTRSYWHIQNIVKSFDALALRYYELHRHYGMFFQHNQSTTALAVLQSLSSFMAVVVKVCYYDIFAPSKGTEMNITYLKVNDDIHHPMAYLIRRLYELVIEPMIAVTTIDNRIRAAATLELLDGILLAPLPFPRDFFTPIPSCFPTFLLSADPNPVFDERDETFTIIESAPKIGFSFYVSGRISVDTLRACRVPVWSIVVWFHVKYVGELLMDDDDDENDFTGADSSLNDDGSPLIDSNISEEPLPDLSGVFSVVSKIHSSGHYFFEVECSPLNREGHYVLYSKLGCRDTNGNDWEIPGCYRNLPIQISRARTITFDTKTESTRTVTQ